MRVGGQSIIPATLDPREDRGLVVAGPDPLLCPVTRMGWQTDATGQRRVGSRQRSVGLLDRLPTRWCLPPEDSKTKVRLLGAGPLNAGPAANGRIPTKDG